MSVFFKRKEKEPCEKNNTSVGPITYQKLFWLFIAGSLLGVPLEGFWCLMKYGNWETHVVTIWFPLCIIYGFGAVGCYIGAVLMREKNIIFKFLVFAAIGDAVEMICGLFLEYSLNMYAWDYRNQMFNVRGYVSLLMTVIWGLLGVLFCYITPFLEKGFKLISGKAWRILCLCLSAVLAVDFAVTAACFVRWKHRHHGNAEPKNGFVAWIDDNYGDDLMTERYCEWHFYD